MISPAPHLHAPSELSESERAKAWRNAMHLTMDQLSELTGYSRESIFLMERGRNSKGKPHAPCVWRRYKLACLAVRVLKMQKVESVDKWQWV
jgi:DNA-binding XRE family transcriptional regulator